MVVCVAAQFYFRYKTRQAVVVVEDTRCNVCVGEGSLLVFDLFLLLKPLSQHILIHSYNYYGLAIPL